MISTEKYYQHFGSTTNTVLNDIALNFGDTENLIKAGIGNTAYLS